MASIYLDVPFITQLGYGQDKSLSDPTGCWYASACMLGYYFEAGPRLGDPSLWTPQGHKVIQDSKTLQKNENLVEVGYPAGKAWPLDDLADLLRKYGPQLISWTKTHNGATYGHCSALIGTDDGRDEVIIHDPENRPNTRMKRADFNKQFMWNIPDSMLRKNVAAHTPKLVAKGGG
jgi:Papain-like cysteine protease AvrRpt2